MMKSKFFTKVIFKIFIKKKKGDQENLTPIKYTPFSL